MELWIQDNLSPVLLTNLCQMDWQTGISIPWAPVGAKNLCVSFKFWMNKQKVIVLGEAADDGKLSEAERGLPLTRPERDNDEDDEAERREGDYKIF